MAKAKQHATCRYCGKQYTPKRSHPDRENTFCKPSHCISFFKRKKATERRTRKARELDARAGMVMDFDGRTSGRVRAGFGIADKPRAEQKRDAPPDTSVSERNPEKREHEKAKSEEAKKQKLEALKEAAKKANAAISEHHFPSKKDETEPSELVARVDNPSMKRHQRKCMTPYQPKLSDARFQKLLNRFYESSEQGQKGK